MSERTKARDFGALNGECSAGSALARRRRSTGEPPIVGRGAPSRSERAVQQ
jgi:hypothetical protein